jgi:hypothetical protein
VRKAKTEHTKVRVTLNTNKHQINAEIVPGLAADGRGIRSVFGKSLSEPGPLPHQG